VPGEIYIETQSYLFQFW